MTDTFWAFIALILFILILVIIRIPGRIRNSLDSRAKRISSELEEARGLREEAQQLLAEYQRKCLEAEQEATNIISAAEREARLVLESARKATEEYIERRNKIAEQKIARAEIDAVDIVHSAAVDLAIAAAEKMIIEKTAQKKSTVLFEESLKNIKMFLKESNLTPNRNI